MRLIVARCEVRYSGRLDALLPEALRLIIIKADGSVLVHADAGGYKPLNWMTPPTVIEESPRRSWSASGPATGEDRLEIAMAEVLSDVEHDMGSPSEDTALTKDGVEAHLQELLAEQPRWCGEGLRLVRREWPTDIGPVDLMCRDAEERVGGGRDQAGRRDRGGRAADPLPRADPPRPRVRVLPRRAGGPGDQATGARCSRARAESSASRSTSRSCAASASRS